MSFVLRYFGQGASDARRAELLRRVMGLGGLILMAVTWRLWTPQTRFPQVPLIYLANALPGWCDWIGAACMAAGLLLALAWPARTRASNAGLLVFAAGAAGMFALDQGRLQPWAYQLAVMALVLAWCDGRAAVALLRLFVVSFYFHSALTKLDYSFMHTLGQQFLDALAGVFGGSLPAWSPQTRATAALVFPLFELLVAVGLCWSKCWRFALGGAVVLHVLLLVILGPWGLDHRPGVLVWNAYFIVQDWLLFAPPAWMLRLARTASDEPTEPPRAPLRAQGLVAAVVLLPLLSSTAWFDMWPSWGLYASSSQRVVLLVHRNQVAALPPAVGQYIEQPPEASDPWLRLRLDRWALDALGAPIYPQARFQLGAALAVIERYVPPHRARVIQFELADRWTGERNYDVLSGVAQLQAAASEYWWNALPRKGQFSAESRAP